jgi:hypothetical protein
MNIRPGVTAALVALVCGVCSAPALASTQPRLTLTPPTVGGISLPPLTVTDPTGITTTVTGTLGATGVVTTVTGAADQVISTLQTTTGTSSTGLPTGTVDTLISSLLGGTSATGSTPGGSTGSSSTAAPGTTGTGSSTTPPGSSANPDTTAPKVTFTLLSKLRSTARTGRLRLRVTSSEESVVAFTAMLRARSGRRAHGKTLKVSHKLVHLKPAVLAFHAAGAQKVTVKVPRKWRKSFADAKAARLSVQAWAADRARNQAYKNLKRSLRH